MEGVILGIDSGTKQSAIKTRDGERYYFSPDEWKGESSAQVGLKVDFEIGSNGQAKCVYPIGTARPIAVGSKPPKTKTAATLWAFFLGTLGAHKFYLGSWGWGLLYLVFCWTYIPFVLAVIEAVRYIVLSDDEFQQKYSELGNGPFSFLW